MLTKVSRVLGVSQAPQQSPLSNHILATLARSEKSRVLENLELVALPAGAVLYESGDALAHIYFPTDAIISLLYTTQRGECSEIALIGNEGLVGVSLFMGGDSTPSHGVVQSSGYAYRLKAALLKKEFGSSAFLQRLLLRYTQGLLMQMAQIAVCNRHHTVDQQLCRWLLMNLDRGVGNKVDVTQELISMRLGVRREGITSSAGKLQSARVIEYKRGHILVLDRAKLEQLCCDCYSAMRQGSQWYLDDEWKKSGSGYAGEPRIDTSEG